MSYQEKKAVANILAGILVVAAYCIYVFGKYRSQAVGLDDLRFCGVTMLIFIGIGIVAGIVIQILFHILLSVSIAVKEGNQDGKKIEKAVESTMIEDEMDRLIELKSMRAGFVVCGVGFIAALVSLVLNWPAGIMLNILFLSFSLGPLVEGMLSLHYYRAGVRNG